MHWHAGSVTDGVAVHAVVISGGHDVDPVLYAQTPRVRPRHDPERDAFESDVIARALACGIPLLGICRGAQLLNIVRGGSLHQSLRSRRRHTGNRRTLLPCKSVRVVAGSTVEAVLGTGRLRVNSLHDQGIDRIGEGLRVVATDRDAIVQAVERPGARFVIGVQWHPEFLVYLPSQRRLFRSLVDAAAASEAVPFETASRP
ncbi:putative glutamine amidotransferase [wastewater metagenome]|uniref:Putative glutamine amidotransferase n=2 Tax=unclassified sequences TaxID=12908 RepID=A0A5B8RA13_9ZZZZ|nr:putative glutamine amidotransferase [uncultured organism]